MNDLLLRAAEFQPESWNPAMRTIQVVWSTGAPVTRYDLEGRYQETLRMSPDAVELGQLRGGPVLNAHNRYDVRDVLGVVVDAVVDGTRGIATVQFGEREEIQGVVKDIANGTIRSISAGYTVQEWRVSRRSDGVRMKEAVRWTPKEISFVPIPADSGAKVRDERKENSMDPQLIEQIRNIAAAVNVGGGFVDGLLQRESVTIEEARSLIVQEAARTQPVINGAAPAPAATVTRDVQDGVVERWADALGPRFIPNHKPAEQARQFVGLRLADYARLMLRERGLNAFGSDAEVVTRSLTTTSDYSLLLEQLFNKVLLPAYRRAPSGMKALCRRATIADFRPRNLYRKELTDGAPERVNEHGEFKQASKTVSTKASYGLDTFGKIFGITRQALINDDMGALQDFSSELVLAAQEFENAYLIDLLTDNPNFSDDKALFHSDHGNLAASGAAPGETTLSAARLAMRMQKTLAGIPANVQPEYILIPAALETTVDKLLASIYAATTDTVNPFTKRLTPIVEPRLDAIDAKAWYVAASPDSGFACIEYAYLSGGEGVQIETERGFRIDGVEIRSRLDFGAGVVDFRGMFKNAGQ